MGRKNGRKAREKNAWINMDVTVNHFANNTKISKSIPKKMASSIVDKFDVLNLVDDDLAWDERSIDEYDELPSKAKRNKTKSQSLDIEAGIEYPLDFWFLISDYIHPEDVGVFAAICQSTSYVVSTAKFWFSLYERYHNWNPEMPEELNRWNMDRVKGLRASVIRSLFYMYSPFVCKISNQVPLNADPSHLVRSQCILQWHSKHSNAYKYYFKFFKGSSFNMKERGNRMRELLPDLIARDSVVHINPEENCTILEITTTEFCKVEMVVGQFLNIALLGLSSNLCNHRLKLEFTLEHLLRSSSLRSNGKKQVVPSTDIIIEPVRDVKIYAWWHPKYFQCRHIEEDFVKFE